MRCVSVLLGLAVSAPLLIPAEAPHVFTPAQKSYWFFQPVKKSPIPAVKNKAWVQTPIDAFILAKLEEKNLQPNPRADKLTLLRRVTIDMTGLPPTPEDIQAFLSDKSPNAWEKVVDRLLASPAYGERWGRHWLDVARYADSNGQSLPDFERLLHFEVFTPLTGLAGFQRTPCLAERLRW